MKIQDDIIHTLNTSGVVTMDNVFIGAIVRRGPDWKWDDQDGLRKGIVVSIERFNKRWVQVSWGDTLSTYGYSYRVGAENSYDLIFAE